MCRTWGALPRGAWSSIAEPETFEGAFVAFDTHRGPVLLKPCHAGRRGNSLPATPPAADATTARPTRARGAGAARVQGADRWIVGLPGDGSPRLPAGRSRCYGRRGARGERCGFGFLDRWRPRSAGNRSVSAVRVSASSSRCCWCTAGWCRPRAWSRSCGRAMRRRRRATPCRPTSTGSAGCSARRGNGWKALRWAIG
jgi:hypothetical protein